MPSNQVLRRAGVVAYDCARLYLRSTIISGSCSCSFICAVAISTVRMRFVRSFTSSTKLLPDRGTERSDCPRELRKDSDDWKRGELRSASSETSLDTEMIIWRCTRVKPMWPLTSCAVRISRWSRPQASMRTLSSRELQQRSTTWQMLPHAEADPLVKRQEEKREMKRRRAEKACRSRASDWLVFRKHSSTSRSRRNNG